MTKRGPYTKRKSGSDDLLIQERREAAGWTQEMLAEAIGVEANTISRYESGARQPSLQTLFRICEVLPTCKALSDLVRGAHDLTEDELDLIEYLRTHPRDKAVLLSTYRGLRDSARTPEYSFDD